MRVKPIGPASTAAKPVVQYALFVEVDIMMGFVRNDPGQRIW